MRFRHNDGTKSLFGHMIVLFAVVLIMQCEHSSDTGCPSPSGDFSQFGYFARPLQITSDAQIYMNYTGVDIDAHKTGLYRYDLESGHIDSILTMRSIGIYIRDFCFDNDSNLCVILGRDIYQVTPSLDLMRITETNNYGHLHYLTVQNAFSVGKLVEPSSGVWLVDREGQPIRRLLPYGSQHVWTRSEDSFVAWHASKSLLHVDSSGVVIDTLISAGNFSRIYPDHFSIDDSKFLFTGATMSDPGSRKIYIYDMDDKSYDHLCPGENALWDDQIPNTFYFSSVKAGEYGIFKYNIDECSSVEILSHDLFEDYVRDL